MTAITRITVNFALDHMVQDPIYLRNLWRHPITKKVRRTFSAVGPWNSATSSSLAIRGRIRKRHWRFIEPSKPIGFPNGWLVLPDETETKFRRVCILATSTQKNWLVSRT